MKFSSAYYPLEWVGDNDDLDLDFTYSCNNNEMVCDKATDYINGLKAYAININNGYVIMEYDKPSLNIGVGVSGESSKHNITISFIMEKISDYYTGGQVITASREDFADFVDVYGIANGFNAVFKLALDEYDTTANLKDYVITNIVITETLKNI